MAAKRTIAIGSATSVAPIATTTATQAAYTADDSARTIEVEGEECSAVSVKAYYTNSAGYAGWSNVVTHPSKAVKDLSGSDQLSRSYHTATR